jgi:hypothetical protein
MFKINHIGCFIVLTGEAIMNGRKMRLIPSLILGLCMFGVIPLAHAEDFKMSNATKYTISLKKGATCLDKMGLTDKHTIQIIPEATLTEICQPNLSKCILEMYTEEECHGEMVGQIILDTNNGIVGITPTGIIAILGNKFNLFFQGDWM